MKEYLVKSDLDKAWDFFMSSMPDFWSSIIKARMDVYAIMVEFELKGHYLIFDYNMRGHWGIKDPLNHIVVYNREQDVYCPWVNLEMFSQEEMAKYPLERNNYENQD
jgi:hypothetical protein